MSRKRINLVKGPSLGKSLTTSSKKGAVAKKPRFSFDAQTSGKAKNGNGLASHGHHPPATAAGSPTAGLPAGAVTVDSPVIVEKIKDLLRIAQDQGYLTYDDINDALPDEVVTPEVLDAIYSKLRGFEVEIVEAPDLERPKPVEPVEEEEESRLDILDDPVQMYLRQMGKVPLLTREQEVAICKRIEEGETEARRILFRFGFTGKEHVALAEKLLSDPPGNGLTVLLLTRRWKAAPPISPSCAAWSSAPACSMISSTRLLKRPFPPTASRRPPRPSRNLSV